MFFTKTDKAREELRPGRRTLTQRERAMLLMADGAHSVTDFMPLFGDRDETRRVALHLIQEGFLGTAATAPVARPGPAPVSLPATATVTPAPATVAAPAVSADTFEGKRSLATTRMFLFDLCERMFVRRDPALAERFRSGLREARDRGSMLATAELLIAEIRLAAGDDRANAIRDRIDRLLPLETVH